VDFDVDQRRRLRSVVEIMSRAFRGWWRGTSSKFSKMTLGHRFGGPIFSCLVLALPAAIIVGPKAGRHIHHIISVFYCVRLDARQGSI
jgi:hypothetical protein